jgi:N,N-dimethylformamidase
MISDQSANIASPFPNPVLEGYTDEISLSPGETITFMVSGSAGEAEVEVCRLIHADSNPAGSGFKATTVDWAQPSSIQIAPQVTDFGSYIEVPHCETLSPPGAFTLALWFCPTLAGKGWHTLAAKWAADDISYAIYICGYNALTAAISRDGKMLEWCTGREPVHPLRWQFAAFAYDPGLGNACLYQWLGDPASPATASPRTLGKGSVHGGKAPLLFGATVHPEFAQVHFCHFNGKIAKPILLGAAIGAESVIPLACTKDPGSLAPVLGYWDLSQEVSGTKVVDVSPTAAHGVAVNAPGRAVTGPFWQGVPASLYAQQPADYDAVHFHDDDLDDARWRPSFVLGIPEDARSGIYAAALTHGEEKLFLPFVVRPRSPQAEVGFLLPTLTWQAYSSNRMAYNNAEDGVLDRGLCAYDVHSDGSPVYYVTRRRSHHSALSGSHRLWGAHGLKADLYLIDWLEEKGFTYDVFADQDLHRAGRDLLDPYRVILLGAHPEYWTWEMMQAFRDYLGGGGRAMYLAGNGLYWVMSIDPERPYLVEVRKSGEGEYGEWTRPQPGEWQHSTTLEVGGTWARRGHPPRRVVGVEFAATVFVEAEGRWGYRRLPASWDKRYSFVFAGVQDELIGDFGLNLGSAAGFEMDAVPDSGWDRDDDFRPVALARAVHDAFAPLRNAPFSPAADIALMEYPDGGAVFSAGSVTWTGSLPSNGYDNSVSRVTENVLRRFLTAPPRHSVLSAD